jgi:N-acetylglucosamine-6-phosphate deacetylase
MATMTIIKNAVVYTPSRTIDDGALAFSAGKIVAVGTNADITKLDGSGRAEVVDARGDLLCPGFIDRHLHGGGGADTMDATVDALRTMSATHASFGVTSFCPATMAAPDGDIERALGAIATAVDMPMPGARIVGAHIEGPCISPDARGAHFNDYVRAAPPTLERLERFYRASRGNIALWTIAPELPGALEFIKAATSKGIRISIGHTKAGYKDVTDAIAAGASSVTHLFNAMAGFHYRDAGGIMAALFSRGTLMAELIADGDHVHPAALHTAISALGKENVILVTDAMRPVGSKTMTSFDLPGLKIFVREGKALTAEGKLCGSLLSLNQAVKNINQMLGRSLQEAISFATTNPARSLGLNGEKGLLAPGMDADMVICDTFLATKRTIVAGVTVYQSK